MSEHRMICPQCGTVAAPGAEWCPMCYLSFARAPEPEAVAAQAPRRNAPPRPDLPPDPAPAAWPCPACGTSNPLELDNCAACGTPFAKIFEEPSKQSKVSPQQALLASLVFPGLGHVRAGKAIEGFARGVVFAWSFLSALLLFISHPSAGSAGIFVALFFGAAAVIYLVSAVDAGRAAEGTPPLLPTRWLLYGSVGLVLLSVTSLLLLTMKAAKVH